MRFQNLTITLTLTCLSIIAIVALALLPITDGICEWTGNDSYKSYSKIELDSDEQGWSLSAAVSASGSVAYASVSPSIYEVGVFTSEKTYSGSSNVRAWRNKGHRWGYSYCYHSCSYYCSGHPMAIPFDADEDPAPDSTSIIYATVDMVTTYLISGRERHWRTREFVGATVTTTVGVDDYASVTAGGEQYSWTENGVKYWEETKGMVTNPRSGGSKGRAALVNNWPSADSGAEIDFNFESPTSGESDISTDNSAKYSGVPLQPLQP